MGNDANDNFAAVVAKWRQTYWDEQVNKLPVFFDMEQSANVLLLASWYLTLDGKDEYGADKYLVHCAKNPYHIVSVESPGDIPSDYLVGEYGNGCGINDNMDYLFEAYHYCPANGSLLVPFYRFDCEDESS